MQVINNISNNLKRQTNCFVITKGPSSGKTTTINLLSARGYNTITNHTRYYLDTQHSSERTIEEIRKHQAELQPGILDMQIEPEKELSPNDIVFLGRAIPDTLAYYRFLNLPEDENLLEALRTASYKKISNMDCFQLVQDYAQNEDEAAQRNIHALFIEGDKSLAFPIIQVPYFSRRNGLVSF